jgi:hypothetical protein
VRLRQSGPTGDGIAAVIDTRPRRLAENAVAFAGNAWDTVRIEMGIKTVRFETV